ncbi:MAG TPA: TatD family hydrolase [Fredinandcohnia sp.]|nr:TatD family hydrolase [Fredinandcohnia sp.]
MNGLELVDSHAHPDSKAFSNDREEMLERARRAGVRRLVAIGQWRAPGDFGGALAIAAAHPDWVVATMGVHPHDCARVPEEDWAELEALCARPEVRAVGETGLDYHYDHSPRDEQRRWFAHQLDLARRLGKPVVIHTREADEDTLAILREARPEKALIHCFTSSLEQARRYVEMGLFVSVAGVVTFAKADELREAVRWIPLDRLLIETDCPYLAPVPHRGQRNEPAYVVHVAERIAELKGVSVEEVARITSANARSFFGID